MTNPSTPALLVRIISVTGDDYETAVDQANDKGGSTDAVVEYLAQWDTGDEIDRAATINGHTRLSDLEKQRHPFHIVDYDSHVYYLQADHHLGFYALYREELKQTD